LKPLRALLVVLVLVVLVVVGLGWFLPARWVQPQIEARLHGLRLEGVGGSIWDGHADQVLAADGHSIGSLNWQLSRLTVFGHTAATVDLNGKVWAFRGHMERLSETTTHWQDVHARFDLTALGLHAAAWGQPQGVLEVDITSALIQAQWPISLSGTGQWENATMTTPQGTLSLGTLHWEAQASNAVLKGSFGDVRDPEGPLQLSGSFGVSALGWRYGLEAQPRGHQPVLQRWLASLGPVGADGTLHLEQSGGFAKWAKGKS
jgi:general secretion pathway protein N